MPLIETVSLITTLANAYQVLRSTKPPGDTSNGKTEVLDASGVLVSHDLAKAIYDATLQRIDAVNSQLNGLVAAAGIVMLASVLAVAASSSPAEAGSPLLILALVLFSASALTVVMLRMMAGVSVITPRDVFARQAAQEPLQVLEDFIRSASSCAEHNLSSLRALTLVRELALLSLAFEVVLLGLWALSA